jgi:cyclophilin family peptidyl-prolyl cis-trans isomerase
VTPTTRPLLAAALAAAALALAACGGGGGGGGGGTTASGAVTCPKPSPTDGSQRKSYSSPPEMRIDPNATYLATMKTTEGDIGIRLDAKDAPNTVNNFVFLACQNFYDGTRFHRVVKDFVIQGGDPTGSGTGDAGYKFDDELPTDGYRLGSVAMANSGPLTNTNGSQFFIVTGNPRQLQNYYSRFGQVVSGLNVAKRIESYANPNATDDPSTQVPTKTVTITDITVRES